MQNYFTLESLEAAMSKICPSLPNIKIPPLTSICDHCCAAQITVAVQHMNRHCAAHSQYALTEKLTG